MFYWIYKEAAPVEEVSPVYIKSYNILPEMTTRHYTLFNAGKIYNQSQLCCGTRITSLHLQLVFIITISYFSPCKVFPSSLSFPYLLNQIWSNLARLDVKCDDATHIFRNCTNIHQNGSHTSFSVVNNGTTRFYYNEHLKFFALVLYILVLSTLFQ